MQFLFSGCKDKRDKRVIKLSPEDRERVFGEHPGAIERAAPGFHDKHLVLAHTQRYRWAAAWFEVVRSWTLCGAAWGLRTLQETASRVVGLDLSYNALRWGWAHFAVCAPVVCADAIQLPFTSESFDAVTCFERASSTLMIRVRCFVKQDAS